MDTHRWREPWGPVVDPTHAAGLERELHKELSTSHVLHGLNARAVATRQDCDDVLFELLDGTGRFAVVHLTWSRHPEPDPRWPAAAIFAGFEAFDQKCMKPDADNWES